MALAQGHLPIPLQVCLMEEMVPVLVTILWLWRIV